MRPVSWASGAIAMKNVDGVRLGPDLNFLRVCFYHREGRHNVSPFILDVLEKQALSPRAGLAEKLAAPQTSCFS
jgi:hypothetical protein